MPAPSAGISMRRLNVLLVEDEADSRALYGYMLALAGHRVKAVSNVLQAFAEIQANRPDLIVTDIAMPIISGLDLITSWRSQLSEKTFGNRLGRRGRPMR
jgi:DNA-binding response OmpR family regulator